MDSNGFGIARRVGELESWRVGELERYLPAPALAPSQTCGQGIPELMVMALSKVPIAQTKKRPKPIEANRSQSKPIEEEAEEVCVLFSIHGKTGFQFCSDM